MFLKIAFWFLLWITSWFVIILSTLPDYAKFLLGLIHMFSHLFIALNIAHDANHNAISRIPLIASILKRSFDLVGISSYCWRINHNQIHHHYTSINGIDSTASGKIIMRFQTAEKLRWFHRYQHYYAPLVYGLVTLNYVFSRDFVDFYNYFKADNKDKSLRIALLECLLFKCFYFCYTLLIPVLILPYSAFIIFGTFLFSHLLLGQLIILIQVPHFNIFTLEVSEDDVSADSKKNLEFILRHSTDMNPSSRFWNWLLGGINNHIVHHLYPQTCHVWHPRLTEELQQFCQKESFQYRSFDSIIESYKSHYAYLKHLGTSTRN